MLAGEPIHGLASHLIARRGLQLVPEDRRIFTTLTVEENLQVAALIALAPRPRTGRYSIRWRATDAGDCPRVSPLAATDAAR
jgi:ABC-type branched-subunit amino acid transport system ATPase component